MYQTGPISIYSNSKLLEFKFGKLGVYITGTPTLVNDPEGHDNWLKEAKEQLIRTNLQPERLLAQLLKKTCGLFSIILRSDNELILASDIGRSVTFFYGYQKNKLFVTDNLEEFQKENGPFELDDYHLEEYLSSGLVYGNKTVYKNIFGIQACEIVTIRKDEIKSERYYEFKPAIEPTHYENLTDFTYAFDNVFQLVFSRMIKQTRYVNRWVIPLSGGHDSRLIVNYLYRLGLKNVLCFSYGTPNNEQSRISKQVAEAVGYEWQFVEYTEEKWKTLHDSGVFDEYIKFAFNGVSTPHLQDFLAVYELKENNKIEDGDIFVPGITGIPEAACNEDALKLNTDEEAIEYAYLKTGKLTKFSGLNSFIFDALNNMYYESNSRPENFFAYFIWQERQAKYITNSIKAYEFFEFEYRLPLWDREVVDFWFKIPIEKRVNREPQFETEKQCGLIRQLVNIPFAAEMYKSKKVSFFKLLKKMVPTIVVKKLLRFTKRKVTLNEGLNKVYALEANSVKELLDPIDDFPQHILPYFQDYFHRFPYQVDPYFLTVFYSIRRMLDRRKSL